MVEVHHIMPVHVLHIENSGIHGKGGLWKGIKELSSEVTNHGKKKKKKERKKKKRLAKGLR